MALRELAGINNVGKFALSGVVSRRLKIFYLKVDSEEDLPISNPRPA